MRKFFPIILGVGTLMWIVGGTVWFKHHFCDAIELPQSATTVAVKDDKSISVYTTPFFFSLAETQPTFISESIPVLKKTADYLNQNIDKALIIKGLYSPKEKALKPKTDLGISRAEAIKSVLNGLGANADDINVESEQRSDLHFVNNQLTDGIELEMVNNMNARFQPLNIYFPMKKFQFKESEELMAYFNNLNKFIILHPEKSVRITAFASNTEGGAFAKKRLTFIKSYLKQNQFNTKKIQFENNQTHVPLTTQKSIKNQRLEIRLVSL